MFANLFFLILNLLLILSATEQKSSLFFNQFPETSFLLFIFSYLLLLPIIYFSSSMLFRKGRFSNDLVLLITNIILIIFFCFFYFFLGSARLLVSSFSPFSVTVFSLFSLLLYFTAMFVCHYALEKCRNENKAFKQAWLNIRFSLPFVIPFIFLNFFSDLGTYFPVENVFKFLGIQGNGWEAFTFFALLNLAIILIILIFLPPLTVLIWGSPKLHEGELKTELDHLCQQAHFKHAGFRIWNIMNHSMTAAIIGVISPLRYVLFTQKLLDHIPKRSIVAILAHEIGHSYHRHLFIYPFILMGMIISASLAYSYLFFPFLAQIDPESALFHAIPLLSFLLFGIAMAIYFRFVFGYFSRLFERQADLHIFKLNCQADDMIDALDMLGKWGGNIHMHPNWHHHSIQQRIDFLKGADNNRSLIKKHANLVKRSLIVYFIIFAICSGLLIV